MATQEFLLEKEGNELVTLKLELEEIPPIVQDGQEVNLYYFILFTTRKRPLASQCSL